MLGVDLESWPLVVAFDVVSLGLVLALLRTRARSVIVATALLVALASIFDIGEIVHQANESQTTLIVIATAVTILHLVALAVAIWIAAEQRSGKPAENASTLATR